MYIYITNYSKKGKGKLQIYYLKFHDFLIIVITVDHASA